MIEEEKLNRYTEILFAECKKQRPLCRYHLKYKTFLSVTTKTLKDKNKIILDEYGLVETPIDATEKMLNAGIEAGAKDTHQAESIYASMLLAFQE